MSARPGIRRQALCFGTALLLLAGVASRGTGGSTRPLRVRASEPFAACLSPTLDAFTRQTGRPVVLEVADPDPRGADLLVGDDSQLTRALEGGAADSASALDLGFLPWVFVVPQGAPAEIQAAAADAQPFVVLGGELGRRARAQLGGRLPHRMQPSRDVAELRRATHALVPRSLAGPGEQRPAGLRPLIAVAVAVADGGDPAGTRALLAFLASPAARALLSSQLTSAPPDVSARAAATTVYANAVVDWWLPKCSLDRNGFNDPQEVLSAPNALSLGGRDNYMGFMSLGESGYVTVSTSVAAIDGPGADVRVFQSVSGEEVTLYAANDARGPFKLVGLRAWCGERTQGAYSNHCDFDLRDAGLSEARYFKIEDGEIYPCAAGDTRSEGADIDAIQVLNVKP